MEDLSSIGAIIKSLRDEMVQAYEKVGDLGNATVIALSQQLDEYLLKFQQRTQHSKSGSSGEDKASIF